MSGCETDSGGASTILPANCTKIYLFFFNADDARGLRSAVAYFIWKLEKQTQRIALLHATFDCRSIKKKTKIKITKYEM